jgi:pimeloyl-ACP methyl ester carboxylesterase
MFLTPSRARLNKIRGSNKDQPNWLFLPGGPGLGSESLLALIELLDMPGDYWCIDLPGDGSNRYSDNAQAFSAWTSALVEAIAHFKHGILVGHSTGGMQALYLPELEKHLKGLILMDTAPNAQWQNVFAEEIKKNPIPGLADLMNAHKNHPSDETLKALTLASIPYLFTHKGRSAGQKLLESLPYNYQSCEWSEQHFDSIYRARWIPTKSPTFIISGEEDKLTPLSLFLQEKSWHRDNIHFKLIRKAGHFPWIENPDDVRNVFREYFTRYLQTARR